MKADLADIELKKSNKKPVPLGRVPVKLARAHGCTLAVLKERSPSCGRGQIYDGSFTGRLTEGSGVTARLLEEHGVQVYGESEAGTLAERGEAREEGQRAPCPLPSKYPGKND